MAFEHYILTGAERLRCGYTTGSCAALAAQAAARMLLGEPAPARVSLTTPSGVDVEVDVLDPSCGAGRARDGVRKDGGDDYDTTDGMLVYAEVACADEPGVAIRGGEGVGRVTKPGLEQPVGAPAINRVPRAMIEGEVVRVFRGHGLEPACTVTVSAPEGAAVGAKTFNPHLGVVGGISILGTTGIVEPKSMAALRDSIGLEISQAAALGARDVVLVPGNYGKDFLGRELPQLGRVPLVPCSNFIGDTLDRCAGEGFERVLLVGHIGKLVKVAAGIMDTHSRVADARVETVCAHAACAGADRSCARALMDAATTDAALDILDGAGLLHAVAASLADATQERLERRAAGAYLVGAVVFSNVRGELYRTRTATALIESMAHGAAAAPNEAVSDERGR